MNSSVDTEILRLWEHQSREEQIIPPLDDIRAKAERLDAKTRRWRIATAVLFALLLVKGAFEVWIQEGILEKAGDLLLMAALVYTAYRYRKRLAAPPVAVGRTNCVDFYRAELVRQHDLSQNSWGFLLPFVPGLALAVLDGVLEARTTSQMIALVAGFVGLFLGIAWWNARTARKLESEIDALDAA